MLGRILIRPKHSNANKHLSLINLPIRAEGRKTLVIFHSEQLYQINRLLSSGPISLCAVDEFHLIWSVHNQIRFMDTLKIKLTA